MRTILCRDDEKAQPIADYSGRPGPGLRAISSPLASRFVVDVLEE
jgi:hypothetical protein